MYLSIITLTSANRNDKAPFYFVLEPSFTWVKFIILLHAIAICDKCNCKKIYNNHHGTITIKSNHQSLY